MSGRAADSLSADHLRRVCDFVYRRTGLSYGEAKRYYIERRVAERMSCAGLSSFSAYLTLLHADRAEAEHLINAFTVNETYFYREEHQLRCLGDDLLPTIVGGRGPGDLVRIWSVPCATGEESYSIAIWLLENWRLVDAYNIEIVGSDIDTRVLEAAMQGEYGERALSRLSPELCDRYFEPACGGQRRIIKDLRESVRHTSVNLIDAASMREHGAFDIVFCRNVLIYFDDASRRDATRNLFDALNPGGFICLGHSESMSRMSDLFEPCRFEAATVYRRPAA